MSSNERDLGSARLKSKPNAAFLARFKAPMLEREKRHFHEFLTVDLAHTVMLGRQGILAPEHVTALLKSLQAIRDAGVDGLDTDLSVGSFLLQVEKRLQAEVGEDVGGRLHTGRSRIDQGATVRRLFKRKKTLEVLAAIQRLQERLVAKAEEHLTTVMPGYTCLQHSQPGVFGHYLLSFVDKLDDDFDRLTGAYRRTNLCPLGAVGLSGTSWNLDRNLVAGYLGFEGPLLNSRLAREAYYAAEIMGGLSFVMSTLNDLCTDLHIWHTFEFGLVELADEFCGTSSVFPQKKNPSGLESVRYAAGEATSWLAGILATFRAEGTGDVVMREARMIDPMFETTVNSLDLTGDMIATLIVKAARMLELSGLNWSTANDLADEIVRNCGLSYRQAHSIVGRLVRNSVDAGLPPDKVDGSMIAKAAAEAGFPDLQLPEEIALAALDPEKFARSRVTSGSIAEPEVRALAERGRGLAAARKQWLDAERDRLARADAALTDAVAAAIASGDGGAQQDRTSAPA